MYYIYHIPGVKIGCTSNLVNRMNSQGFTKWEILEKHRNIYTASKREIELQIEYGYGRDNQKLYCETVKHSGLTREGRIKTRILTFEQAQEIRAKYTGERGQQPKLAKEYGVTRNVIWNIVNNKRYLEP